MRFSTHGSMAMAMAASLASASAPAPVSERHLLDLDLPKNLGEPISANVDIGVDLSDTTLVAGVLAGVAVPPVLGVGAGVEVAVVCDTCYTKGNINASISLDKVVPALKLSLTDIEAKLDLDIKIGAAATIAINLFTPPAPISLPLPGLKVDALVSLDLIIGVETEIDLSAGIDVKLVDEAIIETDILAGKILDAAFSGLSVQVLPIEVRIGCTKLLADLRLRVELGVAADLDLGDVLPILPDIGAGLEVAVFANLLEYIGFFCATPTCPLSKESYGLNIGAAVELDVAVEDLLSIHLAPTLSTALLSYPTSTICEHPSYTSSVPTLTATTSSATATSSATTSGTGSETSSATSTGSGSGSATSTGSGSGSATGTATSTGSGSGSVTGTSSSGPTTTSAPGGVITSTITNTQTFTVTQCAATVPNCPAGYQTTATVVHTTVYTTVCPATQTGAITAPPKPTHTKPATPVTVTKQVVTLVPCSEVSTFTPPANVPTAPYPTGGKAVPSTSVPTGVASTYPAGSPSATYPAGGPSATYPAGSPSATYPAGGPSATYPAGSPSGSYPAGSPSSYPAGGPGVYPTGGAPSGPAYPTVVPPYPTGPAGGSNNTVTYSTPATLSTYVPSASSFYPSSSGYPTAPVETPIPTAGAAKIGSGVAGALAVVGAFVAFM
ncbi:hypothetical protein GGS26DRAFT_556001 [Hypomontagnella submonticulosa]|nr:hypothetical protein GGS26DRAFT_556001 [Hypomontagnella submonticulosa]